MDTPEGFDDWSEVCKKRFRALKAEFDAREAAEDALDEAKKKADTARGAVDKIEEEQDKVEEEREKIKKEIADYSKNRKAKRAEREAKRKERKQRKKELETELKDLKKSLSDEVNAGSKSFDDARDEYQAAKREAKAEIDVLDAEYERLRAEYKQLEKDRRANRARLKQLKDEAKQRLKAAKDAKDASNAADKNQKAAQAALDKLRSEEQIQEDYLKLIRECGPQDPVPGGPSIPVPLAAVFDQPGSPRFAEENRFQGRLFEYALSLPVQMSLAERQREDLYVGLFDDEDRDAEIDPEEPSPPSEPVPIAAPPEGERNWHEGCIEFLWVQGTSPAVDPRLHSNPITKTASQAMRDVNRIFAPCCVRFTAYLKIVTMAQLGKLADANTGISVKGGKTKSVKMASMSKTYPRTIKALQDHKECAGFLVVDEVADGAGFASIGGRRGVVTMKTAGKSRLGDTTAHEVGHAVGGIEHVEGKGPTQRKHRHGELMWGKGCDGYPKREDRRYSTVTTGDCAKMRAKTKDTGEKCDDAEDG